MSKGFWKEFKHSWKNEFAFYLRAKANLSERVVDDYVECVGYVLKHYCPDPTPEDIYRVKDAMLRKGYSHSYVNHIIFAFQHWFAWRGMPVKLKALPRNKTIPRYLTIEEASKLLVACKDPRDRAIVALLLYGGLRANEVCKLTLDDSDLDNRLIKIRDPKNDVEDYAVISERCADILREYLLSRNGIKDNRLFHGNNGHGLTYNCIRLLLRRRSREAGIKHVSAHMLRHTLGTLLVAKGCDVSFVQKQLRHRSISTTMIYVHINKDILKQAYDRYVPEF